jgi:hypothetical protein
MLHISPHFYPSMTVGTHMSYLSSTSSSPQLCWSVLLFPLVRLTAVPPLSSPQVASLFLLRHVVFDESDFPFSTSSVPSLDPEMEPMFSNLVVQPPISVFPFPVGSPGAPTPLPVSSVASRAALVHSCDNPPGKIPCYRLRPIHFGR